MAVKIVKKKELEKIEKAKRSDAEKLKEIRVKLNLTQGELSKKVGVSQSLISCVENGIKPAPVSLKLAITNELGIDFEGIESYDELLELWHKSQGTINSLKEKLNRLQSKLKEIEG